MSGILWSAHVRIDSYIVPIGAVRRANPVEVPVSEPAAELAADHFAEPMPRPTANQSRRTEDVADEVPASSGQNLVLIAFRAEARVLKF